MRQGHGGRLLAVVCGSLALLVLGLVLQAVGVSFAGWIAFAALLVIAALFYWPFKWPFG